MKHSKALPMPVMYGVLGIIFILIFLGSLMAGPVQVNLLTALSDTFQNRLSVDAIILMDIRLPRSLLALLVGVTLGVSGAALQGLLRNPLAEPGIIGVSNGAALGAVMVFYFGLSGAAWFAMPLGGLIGAFLAVLLIFLLAGKKSSVLTLILAGVAINAIGSALIAMALNFSPNPYAMQEIVFWLLGSVSNRSMQDVMIALPFIAVGLSFILFNGRLLDALSFGEETAQTLGFSVRRQRWVIVLGVAMAVGAAVSVTGNIGFVGLVVPHVLRPFVGYEPKKLLLVSGLGGGILLLIADIVVQQLSGSGELKLGVVTALVGGPFFFWLVLRLRHEVA